MLGELLRGAEDSLHADSAYHCGQFKALAEQSDIAFNANECGARYRPLTKAQRVRNRRPSRIRATIEHPFVVVKRLWGGIRRCPTGGAREEPFTDALVVAAGQHVPGARAVVGESINEVRPRNTKTARTSALILRIGRSPLRSLIYSRERQSSPTHYRNRKFNASLEVPNDSRCHKNINFNNLYPSIEGVIRVPFGAKN